MKRIAIVALAACMASAAAFSACAGDDDPVTGGDAAVGADVASSSSSSSSSGGAGDAGTVCAAYAEALCNRYARCTPLLLDIAFGNRETCKEGYTILCGRSTRAPGSAALPASCIDALNAGCGDLLEPLPACAAKGSLTDRTPCEFDQQCASGRCGGAGGTPGCGVCKPASDASSSLTPEGGSCSNEGHCERGLSCLDASSGLNPTRGICDRTRAMGEACLDAEDCNTGFHGDFGWTGFTVACLDGGCAKPLDEGATCSFQNAPNCDVQKKLGCELVTNDAGGFAGRCSKWPFAKANEPCMTSVQTPGGTCYGDNRCVGDGGSGTCVPRSAAGSSCGVDDDCRFGLSCVGGLCTILPADRCK